MSMRLLVLSDTHRNLAAARRALAQAGPVDYVLHLGDNCADADTLAELTHARVVSVCGNCDFAVHTPAERVITVCGQRILLTHGHNHGVRYSPLRLALHAQEQGVQAALFGHTHHSFLAWEQGVLLLNPGSPSEPRGCPASFAVLEASERGLDARLVALDK